MDRVYGSTKRRIITAARSVWRISAMGRHRSVITRRWSGGPRPKSVARPLLVVVIHSAFWCAATARRATPWGRSRFRRAGEKWKFNNAIIKSRFFIALLSSNSVDKVGYGQNELKEALEILDKYPESKVFIIPVRLDDCEVSDSKLKEINYVDLFPSWREGFKKILETIDTYL
ncbi:MAG: toll/interleukin-1 receptor domain-containing protein [Candidatus Nitrosopolaris sp.]